MEFSSTTRSARRHDTSLLVNPEPAKQPDKCDPEAYAGGDQPHDVGDVQRLDARLTQSAKEHHYSKQQRD